MTKRKILACLMGASGIGLIVALNLVSKKFRISNNKKDAEHSIMGFPKPLSRDRFSEDFLDSRIVIGMSLEEVNSILGKPYRYAEFMGTMRASYLFEKSSEKGLNLSGFTVVYRDDKVIEITKMWNSN